MDAEENSKLSEYHKGKLFVGYLKILPILIAGLYLLNTVLSYFNIDWPTLSYLANFFLWLFVMAASYKLHFCEYHRMFLWYIFANNLLCWADLEFGLPVNNWNLFIIHMVVAGIFLFLVLYFYMKNKPKIG